MKILRLPQVIEKVGLSKSTIQRMEAAGDFPKRRQLSHGTGAFGLAASVGWIESELDQWIKNRTKL